MDAARHPAVFRHEGENGLRCSMFRRARIHVTTSGARRRPTGTVVAQRAQPGDALTKRLKRPSAEQLDRRHPSVRRSVPEQAPKLDLITLILTYHDITYLPVDRAKNESAVVCGIEAGGHFVVIDHSAKPAPHHSGKDLASHRPGHRPHRSAEGGFVLESESDFLRDPADSREESSGDAKIPTANSPFGSSSRSSSKSNEARVNRGVFSPPGGSN